MAVEFWGVGKAASEALPMTVNHISAHLLADWVPSLPVNVSSSFVGWPPFLIKLVQDKKESYLTLQSEAGHSERQWKGFLSWMLGVAGTRHILKAEGYRWIAPLSAFYPEADQVVDTPLWHPGFPAGILTARWQPGNKSQLRPDYVALRPLRGAPLQWAAVESKGTKQALAGLSKCPDNWHKQARNVELRVSDSRVLIQRHLVIATRVNPNGKTDKSRRIQLRAWNSIEESPSLTLPREAGPEIAVAQLYGTFRNLRLRANARALALSMERRRARQMPHLALFEETLDTVLEQADAELLHHGVGPGNELPLHLPFETDFGPIKVEIAWATVSLVRELQRAPNPELALQALEKADRDLDRWELRAQRTADDDPFGHRRATLPFGVDVHFPT